MKKKYIFISFDYENDKHYKYLLDAWEANPEFEFSFYDKSSSCIDSNSVNVLKQALSAKINEANITLVIVGKYANKIHRDYQEIGEKNWINYEIAKSKEYGNTLIAVKIDNHFESPEELFNANPIWVKSFNQEAILEALKKC